MSKTKMLCPFSGRLCEECSVYRGRHYYLCFSEDYRGHLDELDDHGGSFYPLSSGIRVMWQFDFPMIKPKSAIDPFTIDLNERDEGGAS